MVLRKARYILITALLGAVCLLASCAAASKSEASPEPSQETTALPPQETSPSPSGPPDRTSSGIESVRETRDPKDYDVLRDAKDYLQVDEVTGTLFIYVWRIESFDFLSDFDNIRHLIIAECYIPEGVTIPRTDALNDTTIIQLGDIYGSGAADVLGDCLPLPKLDSLDISGGVLNKAPLPTIPSLTDLYVSVPSALNVISNNTQITGALCFGVPGMNMVYENIEKLDGLEKFSSIQYLRLPHSVLDISPLSGCTGLRILDASFCDNIDSLKPLYALRHLEEINMRDGAYSVLPEDERAHFTPNNNGDADAVHVYTELSEFGDVSEDEYLDLYDQPIKSFDFLRDYPNLKYLTIINCDIADGLVLPKIETLTRLTVFDQDVLNIIKNNTQLAGFLNIGTGYSLLDLEARKALTPLENLAGLEAFHSLAQLDVGDPVTDISALSGCRNLRWLELSGCTSIDTLKPLYELHRLRMLVIPPPAFEALPQDDQERFRDKHKPYMTDLEWR